MSRGTLPPGGMHVPRGHKSPAPRKKLELTPHEVEVLERVRDKMRDALMSDGEIYGVDCPCCEQFAKVYHRPISAALTLLLLLLYCEYDTVNSFNLNQDGHDLWGRRPAFPSDMQHLVWWSLLEQETEWVTHDEDGDELLEPYERAVPGKYFVSEYAEKWIRDEQLLPSHVRVYNRVPKNLRDEHGLSIFEAVGHEFDLDELLREPVSDIRKALIRRGPEVKRPRRLKGMY